MAKVIGVFDDRGQAENAVNKLKESGISSERISLVGREEDLKHEAGAGMKNDDMMRGDMTTGATAGGTIGGLTGLLAGAGALAIPGLGPILAVGPIAAGLSGAAAGGLVGSLVDLGIPRGRGEHYQEEIKKGGILAVVDTDQRRVDEISSVLKENRARDIESH